MLRRWYNDAWFTEACTQATPSALISRSRLLYLLSTRIDLSFDPLWNRTHIAGLPKTNDNALEGWHRRIAEFMSCSHLLIITFCVSRSRRKMYCGHVLLCVCVSVCLSAAVRPHYCTDPDVTWGRGRGCPLVVHYWAELQSVHGLRCYGNITRTLVTSLRPSSDMTT